MKNFRVMRFELLNRVDHSVFATSRKVVRLTNLQMIDLVDKFRNLIDKLIDSATVEAWIKDRSLPSGSSVQFLESAGLLMAVDSSDSRISQVDIFVGDEHLRNAISQAGLAIPMLTHAETQPRADSLTDHHLWILLMPSYSASQVRRFYECLRISPNVSSIVAYGTGETVYLSSVYTPAYRTPCHFCYMQWQRRSKPINGVRTSLSDLMQHFEESGETELPIIKLTTLQTQAMAAFVVSHAERLCGLSPVKLLQEEVTCRVELDLQTFIRAQYAATHWPGCECQYVS